MRTQYELKMNALVGIYAMYAPGGSGRAEIRSFKTNWLKLKTYNYQSYLKAWHFKFYWNEKNLNGNPTEMINQLSGSIHNG